MKNKPLIKKLYNICLILILALIIEFGHVIIKNIYISTQTKENNYTINYTTTKKKILLTEQNYINKLKIKYKAKKDIGYKISYTTEDNYGKPIQITKNERFDDEIDTQVININKRVKDIKITSKDLNKVQINQIIVDNKVRFNYYIYIYIIGILSIIYLLLQIKKEKRLQDKIHKYFIKLVLILGSLFIILQPATTFYSWDDQIHFTSTYELIGGVFHWKIGERSMIDSGQAGLRNIKTIEEHEIQNNYLNQNKYTEYYSNQARIIPYTKLYYIIPFIGFKLGKLLGMPFNICFKLGKMMILLAYALIMGYAIKISKIGKRLLVLIGLIPTSIFLASQYSYDPAVISGLTVAITMLINWYLDKNEKITFNSMLIFLLAILYASFVKAIYIPILLLFLLIPSDRFKNKKTCYKTKTFLIILMLLVMYTFVRPTVSNSAIMGDTRGGDTSTFGQLSLIFSHPLSYAKVLYKSMIGNFFDYLIGQSALINYAYLGIVGGNLFYIYLIALVFVTITEENSKELKYRYKIPLIIVSLGIIALIWTALYLSYNPVGSNVIVGVQTRYFLPLIFPILICFNSKKIKFDFSQKIYNIIIFAIPSFVIMITLFNTFLIKFCL